MNSIFEPFRNSRFVGFDSLFDQFDQFMEAATNKITWPPYNLAKITEQLYQLQFALAGFTKEEISVSQEGNYLVIKGNLSDKNTGPEMIYKGISSKDFLIKFLLSSDMMVDDIVFDNGILSIELARSDNTSNRLDFKIKTPVPGNKPVITTSGSNDMVDQNTSRSDMMVELEDALAADEDYGDTSFDRFYEKDYEI